MVKRKLNNQILSILRLCVLVAVSGPALLAQGKNPVILIPGLSGSELRHSETKERVWFKTFRSKSEDLRLPLQADSTKMHDKLIATDVLREVKLGIFPGVDIYGGFIKAMQLRGGYTEEKFDAPSADGYQDSLYVFAYDWRLDNVGNARLLLQKLDALRKHFNKPNLKFDIVAHSMGGIISRYAAMYGDAEVLNGKDKFQPTWAGSRYFDKIILIGTPNEGAANALNSLVNGFAIGGMRIDLPFVQDTSKYLVFSVPTSFQLLPAPGSLRVFDDRLEPLEIDLYDTKTWKKYGWDVTNDKDFPSEFSLPEQKAADQYFANVLGRAKRLHEALAAANGKSSARHWRKVRFLSLRFCASRSAAATISAAASVQTTEPLSPTTSAIASDGSPVPPAISRTTSPTLIAAASMSAAVIGASIVRMVGSYFCQ